tara:strand:+ start:1014 stop:1226 length:213 start_codon:yes stop_codon:yes gene_type:complete
MKILVKTNELIFLSWVKHRLNENDINFLVFDEFISSTEGNINAFPIRVLVSENDYERAKKLIKRGESNGN